MTLVCTDLNAPKPGQAIGDPHFVMWDGTHFTYHGECDLVLLDSPSACDGAGLQVHIRTTIRNYYSFIESAAFRIDDNVLEFHAPNKLYMNGVEVQEAPALLGKYLIESVNSSVMCQNQNCTGAVINKINFGKDGFAIVKRYKGFVYVSINPFTDGFLDGVGILGMRNKPGKFGRDGTLLANDYNSYAEDWQVRDWEPQLFKETRYPKYPNACTRPPAMPARRNEDGSSRLAEEACATVINAAKDNCIFDVLATGDIEMAVPYYFEF
jgi:hypothetical protein